MQAGVTETEDDGVVLQISTNTLNERKEKENDSLVYFRNEEEKS